MGKPGPQTQAKRRREQAKREKRIAKEEAKALKKAQKESGEVIEGQEEFTVGSPEWASQMAADKAAQEGVGPKGT
ncbi:MAG: hypothetical protein ACI9WU_003708 [Myxococcota bacterium]